MSQIFTIDEDKSDQLSARMADLCRKLHANPELSYQEFETSRIMANELKQAGFEDIQNFGGNNVSGVYRNGDGPVVMLRTDMDALPVEEKTGLSFASIKKVKNKDGSEIPLMHACGHDIHMAVWAGTLHSLVLHRDKWTGTVVAIAQQAEEVSGGAGLAIEYGLFSKFPKPDFALAFHINPELESGKIGLVSGPVFAGVKTAHITVYGKGGHGAYPEKCIDPVVIASRIVLDLQTIVSREVSPFDPVVVTVGAIHGGNRANIIPDEVKMDLTLRYYSDEVIARVISAIERISRSAALMAGMPEDRLPLVEIEMTDTPPVINDPALTPELFKIIAETLGAENIATLKPAMVGEDFGKFGRTPENVPLNLIWLGSTNQELMKTLKAAGKVPEPLHSPQLMPDYENTIRTGIRVMTANVIGLLKK